MARTPYAVDKTPVITFQRLWEVLLRYVHTLGANLLTPIWIELTAESRDDFRPNLEDS